MKRFLIKFAVAGIVILSSCKPGTKEVEVTNLLQIGLDSIVKTDSLPGATFCLLTPEGHEISIASGLADVEKRQAMPVNAIMFTGSVGKTLVAATVLKLAEEKKLSLDQKAMDFFAGEDWFFQLPNSKNFTIRMLLNHTSGLPDYVYKPELWEQIHQNPGKNWTGEERLLFIAGDTALFEAGKKWSYADANYIVLGMIIEKSAGEKFYDLAQRYFLSPLQLTNTRPAVASTIAGLVAGYTGLSREMLLPVKMAENAVYAFNPQFEWTGGGFTTNVRDLAVWAKALYGGKVLSGPMLQEMLTPAPVPTDLYENAGYGLGAFVGETNSTKYYGHTGFVPGYVTVMQYVPDFDIAIALQINTDDFKGKKHKMNYCNLLKNIVLKVYSAKMEK